MKIVVIYQLLIAIFNRIEEIERDRETTEFRQSSDGDMTGLRVGQMFKYEPCDYTSQEVPSARPNGLDAKNR